MMLRALDRTKAALRPHTMALFFLALIASIFMGPSVSIAADFQPLEIVTKSGVKTFSVELAKTEQERETGLMYRKELPDGQGMLFDFAPEQNVQMWMKNTLISLDMLFIQGDGRISRIAENTTIESERIIPSGGPVRAVLEVSAGTAKKMGIAVGDHVAGVIFGK